MPPCHLPTRIREDAQQDAAGEHKDNHRPDPDEGDQERHGDPISPGAGHRVTPDSWHF